MTVSSTFIAEVSSAIQGWASAELLAELTNIRAAESEPIDPEDPIPALTINTTRLDAAILYAAAEVQTYMILSETDPLAVKFTMELVLSDLCTKAGRKATDLGFTDRDETLRRMNLERKRRVAVADGLAVGKMTNPRNTTPSGFDPWS